MTPTPQSIRESSTVHKSVEGAGWLSSGGRGMSKGQHKRFAMTAALRVGACKGEAKEKARRDCLDHLRASLLPGGAGSRYSTTKQVELCGI